jgi:hypothetical protein
MGKKKKSWVVAIGLACLVILSIASLTSFNPSPHEKKIAQYLFSDQPKEAIREIKILLLFHPKNIYGIRMRDLLTLENIHYP